MKLFLSSNHICSNWKYLCRITKIYIKIYFWKPPPKTCEQNVGLEHFIIVFMLFFQVVPGCDEVCYVHVDVSNGFNQDLMCIIAGRTWMWSNEYLPDITKIWCVLFQVVPGCDQVCCVHVYVWWVSTGYNQDLMCIISGRTWMWSSMLCSCTCLMSIYRI